MLEIKSVEKGAELISVKLNGIEKLHDGETFWNRHSPILFPIVGKLKDNKTIIAGKVYEIGQHGFARDLNFEKIGDNSYVLKSNEETLKKFPFKFELYVSYEVKSNKLSTRYKVVNKDEKQMIFGLGGHPAFVCDYSSGKYRIEFEEIEDELKIFQLEDGLVSDKETMVKKYFKENRIFLDKHTFEKDAIIMKNLKSNKVYLKTEQKKILCFDFTGFKYLAIWSKENAPFICIEPWFNTADTVSSEGYFEEKENILKIDSNEEFECKYTVEFFE